MVKIRTVFKIFQMSFLAYLPIRNIVITSKTFHTYLPPIKNYDSDTLTYDNGACCIDTFPNIVTPFMIRILTPGFLLADAALRYKEGKLFLLQIGQAVLVGAASGFVMQWETQDQKLNEEISAGLEKHNITGFLDALDKAEDLTPTWLRVNLEPASIIISTFISNAESVTESVTETYNQPALLKIRSSFNLHSPRQNDPQQNDPQQLVDTPPTSQTTSKTGDNPLTLIQVVEFASEMSNAFAVNLNFFKPVFGVAQLCTLIQKTDAVWYKAKSEKMALLEKFQDELKHHSEGILGQYYNCSKALNEQQQQNNTKMLYAIFHGDCSKIEQAEVDSAVSLCSKKPGRTLRFIKRIIRKY